MNTLFVSENVRAAVNEGRADFTPCRLGGDPAALLVGSPAARRRAHPRHAARRARLLLLRRRGRRHEGRGPGREARHRRAEPEHAADARRLLHPHQPDPQDRPGRLPDLTEATLGKANELTMRIGKHVAGHDRGRLDDADGDRRDPRRGPELPQRQEGPRRPHGALLGRRRRPLREGRHHGGEEDDPPREDDRGLPDRLEEALRLRRQQPDRRAPTRPSTSTTRTSSGRTTSRSRSTRRSRST